MACCDWPSRAAQYPMPKWHWTTRLFWMPFSVSHSTGKPPLSLSVFIPAIGLVPTCKPSPSLHTSYFALLYGCSGAPLRWRDDGESIGISCLGAKLGRRASCSARCTGSLRVWHIKMNPVITDEVALKVIPPFPLQPSGSTSRPFRFDAAKPPKLG